MVYSVRSKKCFSTNEVAGVRIIIWVWYKRCQRVVYVVPINLLKQCILSQCYRHNRPCSKYVTYSMASWKIPVTRWLQYNLLLAFHRANTVHKQNNCVHRAVIDKLLLLRHDACNSSVYKHNWPDKVQVVCTAVEYVMHLENELLPHIVITSKIILLVCF